MIFPAGCDLNQSSLQFFCSEFEDLTSWFVETLTSKLTSLQELSSAKEWRMQSCFSLWIGCGISKTAAVSAGGASIFLWTGAANPISVSSKANMFWHVLNRWELFFPFKMYQFVFFFSCYVPIMLTFFPTRGKIEASRQRHGHRRLARRRHPDRLDTSFYSFFPKTCGFLQLMFTKIGDITSFIQFLWNVRSGYEGSEREEANGTLILSRVRLTRYKRNQTYKHYKLYGYNWVYIYIPVVCLYIYIYIFGH